MKPDAAGLGRSIMLTSLRHLCFGCGVCAGRHVSGVPGTIGGGVGFNRIAGS